MNIEKINLYIQNHMLREDLTSVKAVEAAEWLDKADLLKDSPTRRGGPLRDLLRKGLISNSWQDSKKRWFIDREK
jgi:hypothetical protein